MAVAQGLTRHDIEEAAALWVARLESPRASEADRAAFETWRAADPAHAAAYLRLKSVSDRLGALNELRSWERAKSRSSWPGLTRPPSLSRGSATENLEGDSFARADARALGGRVKPGHDGNYWGRRAVLGAMGIAAALLVAVVVMPTATAIETGVGERRSVRLDDGSFAELNTNTQLSVAFAAHERRVELSRGEALFRVEKDAKRPFRVVAGDTMVQAVGTVFDVRREGARVEVIVSEGTVRVTRPGAPAQLISAKPSQAQGQALTVKATGAVARAVGAEEISRKLAWRQGMVAFDGDTLAAAAAELNRHNLRQVRVDDPAVASIRIGGYFRSTDVEGFVRAVTSGFPVRAERAADGTIVLKRKD